MNRFRRIVVCSALRRVHPILRDTRGIVFMEFVVMAPVLLALLFGAVEAARLAVMNKKVNDFAQSIADVLTQSATISAATIDGYLANGLTLASRQMSPFPWDTTLAVGTGALQVYVRSMGRAVSNAGQGGACTTTCSGNCWTRAAGVLGVPVQINANAGGCVRSAVGGPCLVQLAAGEDVLAVEVHYRYEPILPYTAEIVPALAGHNLTATAILRPRQNALVCLGG